MYLKCLNNKAIADYRIAYADRNTAYTTLRNLHLLQNESLERYFMFAKVGKICEYVGPSRPLSIFYGMLKQFIMSRLENDAKKLENRLSSYFLNQYDNIVTCKL